ncbi:hypothetical protein GUJ93_ZPchr0012g19619 [Zizania palustris]|uniref:Uncharacterized protein n=1 Tax=Zizania palustris TaxID=103762 RepID=A0A8J5WIY7_ZIZPA|nr:hypothetical protein GUJ93_ZPchr0012g19619 [Zizania palustris]
MWHHYGVAWYPPWPWRLPYEAIAVVCTEGTTWQGCGDDVEPYLFCLFLLNYDFRTQNSDESTLSLSSPDVTIEEHANHNSAAQDAEPTEVIPMTENVTHQEQFSEEVNMDTVAETAEVEGTVIEKNEFEHEEEKAKGELVELVGLPAYSSVPSLIKRTEKKSPANTGWNERGVKLEQDFTDSVLKEHELTKGGAVLTMDFSCSYVCSGHQHYHLHTLIHSFASNMIFR